MFDEFALEVFYIKIKIKSCLRNITQKTALKTDTFGIKNKNKIRYHHDGTIIKLEIRENDIYLARENKEFIHTFNFKLNQETNSEYLIKEYNFNLEVMIITTALSIRNNKIIIKYTIKDTNEKYEYVLDME